MIGGPGRAPDRGARDVEPDGDIGKLGADRLMLDDAAAALHAELRIFQRGLVGGAADAEVERLRRAGMARPVSSGAADAEQVLGRHADVLQRKLPAGAVIPARLGLLGRR